MKALLRRLQKLEEEMEREEAATRTYQLIWINPETREETNAY